MHWGELVGREWVSQVVDVYLCVHLSIRLRVERQTSPHQCHHPQSLFRILLRSLSVVSNKLSGTLPDSISVLNSLEYVGAWRLRLCCPRRPESCVTCVV